jgi:hypothetical protein
MRRMAVIGVAMLAGALLCPATMAQQAPRHRLNTLEDFKKAIQKCWRWPPVNAIRTGMELTVRLSFKSDGEIFGARVTHQSADVSDDERLLYYRALVATIKRCSPLPVTPELGAAIAGRPFFFRFVDIRKQREALLHG